MESTIQYNTVSPDGDNLFKSPCNNAYIIDYSSKRMHY